MALLGAPHLVVGAAGRTAELCARLTAEGVDSGPVDSANVHRLVPGDSCALTGWILETVGGERYPVAGVVVLDHPHDAPWLDPGMLDWEMGEPELVAGLLAPGLANLYFLWQGTAGFRTGSAALLLTMIRAQAALDHPLVDDLMTALRPVHGAAVGRAARRIERRLERRLHAAAGSWQAAAGDLDGPLAAARGA